MGRPKIPREIRFCLCNCGRSFECKINSKQKFINHHGRILPRETRICICGCGKSFEVKINSIKKYINGHNPQIHKIDCGCFACRNKRGDPHKSNCNCMACRMIRGETKGEKCPFYGKKHTLETRQKMIDNHVDVSSNKNSNWQNGISKLPYSFSFNDELKEQIRKRDNYQCQNPECNMTEEEHLIVYGCNLHVHHINYDKFNCEENNLISLCVSCNIRANYNRYYWEKYYQEKIKEIINGRY